MRLPVTALLLAAGCGLAAPALAQPAASGPSQGDIVVNLRLTVVAPEGTDSLTTLAGGATGLRTNVSNDIMPTLGVSYYLTDTLAIEAIAGTPRHTVRAQGPGTDIKVKKSWVLPPVVTLQYHFAPGERIRPYVGAGLNYMLFYSGSDRSNFHFKIKDGFGTALQAGVDIAANDRWSINLDAKKVFFDTTATDRVSGLRSKVTLDPWVVSGGLGYRF
jgi:outer membrane protein